MVRGDLFMRVLLINPVITVQKSALDLPLNLIFLATAVKRDVPGSSVVPVDLTFECLRDGLGKMDIFQRQVRHVERIWREQGPFDIVALSGLCTNFPFTVRLAEHIKRRFPVPLVVGGAHATFIAKELLQTFQYIDYVIRNDGAEPLAELCSAIRDSRSVETVRGLTYRSRDGKILENSNFRDGPGVLGVDPDYSVLPVEQYFAFNPRLRLPVLAGTGCPFNCSYCSTSLMWNRHYRVRPALVIAQEVARLAKAYGASTFSLVHDNLLFKRSFVLELCAALQNLNVRWGASSRLEHVDDDEPLLQALSRSGCGKIFIGVESGSMRVQKLIRKGVAVPEVADVARQMLRNGIKPVFSFIVGFPQERRRERDDTVRLAFSLKALGALRVNILSLSPLPGTDVAKGNLLFSPRKNGLTIQDIIPNGHDWTQLIRSHPTIFTSFFYAANRSGRICIEQRAVSRLHEYCSTYPRAFDYLFSKVRLAPSRIIPLLTGRPSKRLYAEIESSVSIRQYRMFRVLMKYESAVKSLAARPKDAERAASRNPAPGIDWLDSSYSFSKRAALLRCGGELSGFLQNQEKIPPSRESQELSLCLLDSGERISTYEIPRSVDLILRRISRGGCGSLRALVESEKLRPAEIEVLWELLRLGALR